MDKHSHLTDAAGAASDDGSPVGSQGSLGGERPVAAVVAKAVRDALFPRRPEPLDVVLELSESGGGYTRIVVDGRDLTRHVRAVSVEGGAGDFTRVRLDLVRVRINAPGVSSRSAGGASTGEHQGAEKGQRPVRNGSETPDAGSFTWCAGQPSNQGYDPASPVRMTEVL